MRDETLDVANPLLTIALFASLRRLPETQVEVIVLAFHGELSHSRDRDLLDLPAGTVGAGCGWDWGSCAGMGRPGLPAIYPRIHGE